MKISTVPYCLDDVNRIAYRPMIYKNLILLPGTRVNNLYLVTMLTDRTAGLRSFLADDAYSSHLATLQELQLGFTKSIIVLKHKEQQIAGFIVYRRVRRLPRVVQKVIKRKRGWRTLRIVGLYFWTEDYRAIIPQALNYFVQAASPCYVWFATTPSAHDLAGIDNSCFAPYYADDEAIVYVGTSDPSAWSH